jgi:hypothetical protein
MSSKAPKSTKKKNSKSDDLDSEYSRKGMFFVDLRDADDENEIFLLSIGKIYRPTLAYEDEDFELEPLEGEDNYYFNWIDRGDFEFKPLVKKYYLSDMKKRDEIISQLLWSLYRSGIFINLHDYDHSLNYQKTLNDSLNGEDSFLLDTFSDILGEDKTEFRKYIDDMTSAYICTDTDAAKIEKFSEKTGFKQIVSNAYEDYDECLSSIYDVIVQGPSLEDLNENAYKKRVEKQFRIAKGKIGVIMKKLVVKLVTLVRLPEADKLVTTESVCIRRIYEEIDKCKNAVQLLIDDVGANKEKLQELLLPSTNPNLSWFEFTQIALSEVFYTLKANNSEKLSKKPYRPILQDLSEAYDHFHTNKPENKDYSKKLLKNMTTQLQTKVNRGDEDAEEILNKALVIRKRLGYGDTITPEQQTQFLTMDKALNNLSSKQLLIKDVDREKGDMQFVSKRSKKKEVDSFLSQMRRKFGKNEKRTKKHLEIEKIEKQSKKLEKLKNKGKVENKENI